MSPRLSLARVLLLVGLAVCVLLLAVAGTYVVGRLWRGTSPCQPAPVCSAPQPEESR